MFFGRVKELKTLRSLLDKTSVSAMIYGKRKVGFTDKHRTFQRKHNAKKNHKAINKRCYDIS